MKYFPILALIFASCASHKTEGPAPLVLSQTAPTPAPVPRAQIYKMAGPATAANVPVQVNAQGQIVSFPAPTDLTGQEPIALTGGWLLDRRGINANTRFTTYTYAEYSKLAAPPTLAELQSAIIPDARVTDLRQLPITTAEAVADTAALTKYL